jgi:hypothetical protein
MIKCIYRTNDYHGAHCGKEADYIYLGKSYCSEHLEIRAVENQCKHTDISTISFNGNEISLCYNCKNIIK